jgi:hypothetical protein
MEPIGRFASCGKCESRNGGKHAPDCTIEQRFWRKVRLGSGCWEWQGARNPRYGHIHTDGRNIAAHRYAYELAYGPIPKGTVVMHTCDNPGCVRADHLKLGTQADNLADCRRKGRRPRY